MKEYSLVTEQSVKCFHFWAKLSCWNPWDRMEWKKSIEAYRESNPFFIEIVIALICVKLEWRLTLKGEEKND